MKRVLVIAISAALLGVPALAKKNNWAQQQQLLLMQQQQAAAAAGGQTEAQREQAVRDAMDQQNQANALKMQQMKAHQAAAPAPVYGAQSPDISGPWTSQWGACSLSLSPNGDGTYTVTGSWEQGWNKKAIFTSGKYVPSAHTMALNYLMPWKNMSGTAQFTVAPSGTQLTGSWRQPDGTNPWTLTRMPGYQVTWLKDNRPSHHWPQQERVKDISGDWNSSLGPVSIDLDRGWNGMYSARGTWMQAPGGQRIRLRNGIYRPGPAPTLSFDYEQRWTRTQGSASLTLNATGTELRGTYSEAGRSAPWVLNRAPGFIVQDL
jgi:hypothetical protein